MCFIA